MPAPTLTQFRCRSCTHRWLQAEDGLPLACPACESQVMTGDRGGLASRRAADVIEVDQSSPCVPLAA